jgi:putative hydrolase of the HAD superfamily
MKTAFSHVRTWVFDLDNTLYPVEARLFDQIEVKMTDYVVKALGVARPEADRLRDPRLTVCATSIGGNTARLWRG